ncbi:MAG: multidrug effflux MFS transporter [Flavobacteriales bacterium]|jgi:DHA1 family bicyclomycin/chloramphenicol resistance-like MFS transporter|nr:multidrug effflux MFS transporter [Flavobacteriales bacterium]
MIKNNPFPGQKEFIVIVALMMALVALAIDMMLPALPKIGAELGVVNSNDNQLIISFLFLGIAFGQLVYGPMSDSYGRKFSIYIGFAFFLIGCMMSLFSNTLFYMLLGRFIQGFGLAGPRIISVALVRDRYLGEDMARIMSVVMAIFIIVPILAPALGQYVLNFATWKTIFISFIVYALILLIWFAVRMPETLKKEHAHAFSLNRVVLAAKEVFNNRVAVGYTLAAGCMSGMFLAYLNSSQQLFQETYKMGELYAVIFALLAFAVGIGSFLNGQVLVKRHGMRKMVRFASSMILLLSITYYGVVFWASGVPELWTLLSFFVLTLFHMGILFGNLNSLAMEPLGHIAGVGSTIVGALSTFISVPFGIWIGLSFDGTVAPLILGFVVLGGLTFTAVFWAGKENNMPINR